MTNISGATGVSVLVDCCRTDSCLPQFAQNLACSKCFRLSKLQFGQQFTRQRILCSPVSSDEIKLLSFSRCSSDASLIFARKSSTKSVYALNPQKWVISNRISRLSAANESCRPRYVSVISFPGRSALIPFRISLCLRPLNTTMMLMLTRIIRHIVGVKSLMEFPPVANLALMLFRTSFANDILVLRFQRTMCQLRIWQ